METDQAQLDYAEFPDEGGDLGALIGVRAGRCAIREGCAWLRGGMRQGEGAGPAFPGDNYIFLVCPSRRTYEECHHGGIPKRDHHGGGPQMAGVVTFDRHHNKCIRRINVLCLS